MISKRLEATVRKNFSPAEAEDVLRRLGSLNLALAEKQSLERIQAAIVLLARDEPELLEYYARLAEADWRDVLVRSGLGSDEWPYRLDGELGPP